MSNITHAPILSHARALDALRAHPKAETPDIEVCFKSGHVSEYTPAVHAFCMKANIDILNVFALPQKQVKRFCQFVGALVHSSIGSFDYTHARILIALDQTQRPLTRAAIVSLAADVIRPGADTRGISRSVINRLCGFSHSLKTVESKVSNSTGTSGFYHAFNLLNSTERAGSKDRTFTVNRDSPIFKLFCATVNRASDSEIEALAAQCKVRSFAGKR